MTKTKRYVDRMGYIHNIPIPPQPQPQPQPKIDYMKELDRLYKKAFPDKDKPKPKPINEVKKFHELINDKV